MKNDIPIVVAFFLPTHFSWEFRPQKTLVLCNVNLRIFYVGGGGGGLFFPTGILWLIHFVRDGCSQRNPLCISQGILEGKFRSKKKAVKFMKHFHFSWMFWQNTVFLENFQLLFSRNNIAFLYTYFRAKIKKRHYLRSCWLWGLILGKITSWPNMSILNSFSIPSENERKIFFFYFFLHMSEYLSIWKMHLFI
jgi:hypothetical protein